MGIDDFRQHWALIVAVLLGLVVAFIVVMHLYRRSPGGLLRAAQSKLQKKRRELSSAERAARKAESRLRKLAGKADRVPPRRAQEAKDALQDARALQKIAHDQVLIARNQLRKVIHEEHPPRKHDALRARYLPDDEPDQKPFSF